MLIPEQFCFREIHFHSSADRLVESITEAGCKDKKTIAFFVDVETAFDSVWQESISTDSRKSFSHIFSFHSSLPVIERRSRACSTGAESGF